MKRGSVIEDVVASGIVPHTLEKMHLGYDDVMDIAQDLYLGWLQNDDGLMEAIKGDYLRPYIVNACRNRVATLKKERMKFVDICE